MSAAARRGGAEVARAVGSLAVAALRHVRVARPLDRVVVGDLRPRRDVPRGKEAKARQPVDEPLLDDLVSVRVRVRIRVRVRVRVKVRVSLSI